MTQVRFTANRLGTLLEPADARMADEVVNAGDVGELLPAEETASLVPEGWRLARTELGTDVVRYVPVHPEHYEVLDVEPISELADPPTPEA